MKIFWFSFIGFSFLFAGLIGGLAWFLSTRPDDTISRTIPESILIKDERLVEVDSFVNYEKEKFIASVGFGGAGGLGIGIGVPEVSVNKNTFVEQSESVDTIFSWHGAFPNTRGFLDTYGYKYAYVKDGVVFTYKIVVSGGGYNCQFDYREGNIIYFKSPWSSRAGCDKK